MKKLIISLVLILASIATAEPVTQQGTKRPVWKAVGYCTAGDANVLDASGLVGTESKWSTIDARYVSGAGTISTVSVPRAITAGVSDNVVKIRFRGSAVTTNGTFEVWLVTGSAEDGEFVCDIALTADASASGATMGGYYFGNVNDTNDAQTVTYVRKSNCDTNHRMGVFSFDVKTGWYVVIVPKTVTNGIVYWDYCGY